MIPKFFNNEKMYIKNIVEKHKTTNNSYVLDIGCSDFKPYSEFLASCFENYTGIDIDEKALEAARGRASKHENARIEIGSAEQLGYSEKSFDLVIFNNAAAYTNKQKSFSEAYRVLKPGGILISCFNNTFEYSLYKLIHPMKPLVIEWGHTFVVLLNTLLYTTFGLKVFRTTFNTKKELENIVKSLGADIKEVEVENKTHPYRVINIVAGKAGEFSNPN